MESVPMDQILENLDDFASKYACTFNVQGFRHFASNHEFDCQLDPLIS